MEQLRSDVQKLRADIAHLAATLARMARAGVREVGENACGSAEGPCGEWLRAPRGVSNKIQEHPAMSSVAALGLGLLLGRLLSSRDT